MFQCKRMHMPETDLPESWALLRVRDKAPHDGQLTVLSVS